MEREFWLQKWADMEVGFHQQDYNALMVKHFHALGLLPGARVFVPLCGASVDMLWLVSQGFKVVGVELCEQAVLDFFQEHGLKTDHQELPELTRYYSGDIEIYVGDLFSLTSGVLGHVDAVYDRAAIVALPETMRLRYANHLLSMCSQAPQLLISFDYDQSCMSGPPFSVPFSMLSDYYHRDYSLDLLESVEVVGGLKGKCSAAEQVYKLSPLS